MVGRISLIVTGMAFLVGCQTEKSMMARVPPPTFNSPQVAPQPRTSLPPIASKAQEMPVKPPTRPYTVPSGIPKDWIPKAPLRNWQWIVIHHSATPTGGASAFDRMHKAKGWDGLGYDFVIGNGTDTGNGQTEVGYRWVQQLHGAHAKTADNRFNEHGIGICLVGNFEETNPTPQQMQALARLVAHLMKTYRIAPDRILGHDDTKITACPGKHLRLAAVRRMATQLLAEAGSTPAGPTVRAYSDKE